MQTTLNIYAHAQNAEKLNAQGDMLSAFFEPTTCSERITGGRRVDKNRWPAGNLLKTMVARDGIEPPTPAFSWLKRVAHHASESTYEPLHQRMAAEKCSRVLTNAHNGKKHHLPIGTYWTESCGSVSEAIDAAKIAALPLDAKAEFAVAGDGNLMFYGCPEVHNPQRLSAPRIPTGVLRKTPSRP